MADLGKAQRLHLAPASNARVDRLWRRAVA